MIGRNRKRQAAAYARNYGERGDPVRAMGCLLTLLGCHQRDTLPRCEGPVEAAHVVGRKMGGVGGDRRSLVPLCRLHHREQGTRGIKTFEEKYKVNLAQCAETIARELDARGTP